MRAYRSRAPLRLGLAGGGTDVSPYADECVGAIINVTIDMFVSCTLVPNDSGKAGFFDQNNQRELVVSLGPVLEEKKGFELYIATHNSLARNFDLGTDGFDLFTFSEAPPGSGLGGSSTMIVAIIKVYSKFFGLNLGSYDIARLAVQIEREDLGWAGGRQDQYAAAFGGVNFMEFHKENMVFVEPLILSPDVVNEFEARAFVGFTGISRLSSEIIDSQIEQVALQSEAMISKLNNIKADAYAMKDALLSGDFPYASSILKRSWNTKKNTSRLVSCSAIDNIVDLFYASGGDGCKVSGAGGGGFMLFLTDPLKKSMIMNEMTKAGLEVRNIKVEDRGASSWSVKNTDEL